MNQTVTTNSITPQLLETSGLLRLEKHFKRAGVHAEELAKHAGESKKSGTGSKDGCMLQESGVEATSAQPTPGTVVYVVDCGGTKTTINRRAVDASSNEVSWENVRSGKNSEFDVGDPAKLAINRYFSNLLGTIKTAQRGEKDLSLALTWSNGLKASKAPDGVLGVGAQVDGVNAGSYRKGEPFVEGLYNGFDLGAAVAAAAKEHGLTLKRLIIANDTIFTANSHPGCDAGIICSTGANGTLIITDPEGRRMLFNAESGGSFKVAHEWLADCEREYAEREKREVCIEDLCAGLESAPKGLGVGRLLSLHACHLARRNGVTALAPVATLVEKTDPGVFDGRAVTLLAKGDFDKFKKLKQCFEHFDEAQLNALHPIAEALEHRAGLAAALLSHLSVARDVSATPRTFTVALDSRIADGSAIFRAALEHGLRQLLQGNTVVVEYKKATKEGITVPTQGGASSLDQLMQRYG